jgi:hypothetical protein
MRSECGATDRLSSSIVPIISSSDVINFRLLVLCGSGGVPLADGCNEYILTNCLAIARSTRSSSSYGNEGEMEILFGSNRSSSSSSKYDGVGER